MKTAIQIALEDQFFSALIIWKSLLTAFSLLSIYPANICRSIFWYVIIYTWSDFWNSKLFFCPRRISMSLCSCGKVSPRKVRGFMTMTNVLKTVWKSSLELNGVWELVVQSMKYNWSKLIRSFAPLGLRKWTREYEQRIFNLPVTTMHRWKWTWWPWRKSSIWWHSR